MTTTPTEISRLIKQFNHTVKFNSNMKNVLLSDRVSFNTRLRLLQCYVWSVLWYGCETWTISKGQVDGHRSLVLAKDAKDIMDREEKQ